MAHFRKTLCTTLAACALGLAFGGAACAADASPWAEDNHAAARLIAGSGQSSNGLRAGIEIKMTPGWHTYWRYPGDSGVPPRFDFTSSKNLGSVEVHFPAPHLFTDETGNSLGYADGVIFPVQVTPKEPGKPVVLDVKLEYAVCEKLCVPAEARMVLPLAGAASSHDPRLAAAAARVPKPVAADALGLSLRRVNDDPKPLIAVDLKAPTGKPVQVFVEGPTPEWALPVPEPAQDSPAGLRRFNFVLDGLPPGTDPKGHFELTFTVVAGEQAFETKARLQ